MLVVYSLGNFLLPKDGSITKAFLAGRAVGEEDVTEYLKKMDEVFSLTQQAYVVKITINRWDNFSIQEC